MSRGVVSLSEAREALGTRGLGLIACCVLSVNGCFRRRCPAEPDPETTSAALDASPPSGRLQRHRQENPVPDLASREPFEVCFRTARKPFALTAPVIRSSMQPK